MRFRIPSREERNMFTAVFMVNWMDCPHLYDVPEKREFREKMIRQRGINSSFIRSTLFGEFMRDTDDNHLFMEYDMAALREVMKNGIGIKGTTRAAIDLSTTGEGDEKVMYIAIGTEVLPAFTSREPDTTKAGDYFVEILRRYKVEPRNCRVDNGGSGKPIVDYIERIGYRPVIRYMNNQTPRYRAEYRDLITEDHYAFKELIHNTQMKLPYDMLLLAQAKQRKIDTDDHDKTKLQSKRTMRIEGEESPDRLDCIVMLFSGFVPPHSASKSGDPVFQKPWSVASLARSFQHPAQNTSMHGLVKMPELTKFASASGIGKRHPF